MTTQARSLPCDTHLQGRADGWLERLGRAVAVAYRDAHVSHHELDRRLLADINAPQEPATPDDIRDAYRLWFGGDPTRFL